MWSFRKYSSAPIAARQRMQKCFPVRSGNARGGGSSCMGRNDSSPLPLAPLRGERDAAQRQGEGPETMAEYRGKGSVWLGSISF